jgi:hypothetical protein
MRRFPTLALALVLSAATARSQALQDRSFHAGPQYVSYKLNAPINETVSEFVLPIALVFPLADRFSVDIGTSWASATVDATGSSSKISGLTDTQLRANYVLGNDAVIITAGLNIPTGSAEVSPEQRAAAGRIGNDFFAFPVSNMGTGFGGTGGVAYARAMGGWNVGMGLSLRYSAAYTPFTASSSQPSFRFEPGNEYRARIGGDRPLGSGRFALGLSYSKFGNDQAGGFAYSTGDRVVAQGAYSVPLGSSNLYISGWNLTRLKGQLAAGQTAPWENVANLNLAWSFDALGTTLEPNAEMRGWSRDGGRAARLASGGLRLHMGSGAFAMYPGVSVSTGGYLDPSGATANISGWRAGLLMRYAP